MGRAKDQQEASRSNAAALQLAGSTRRSSRPSNNAARRMSAIMIHGGPVLIADETFQAFVPPWSHSTQSIQPSQQQQSPQDAYLLGVPAPSEAELLKQSVDAARQASKSKELKADLLEEVKAVGTKKTVEGSVDRLEFEAWCNGKAWEYVQGTGCGPGGARWTPGSPYFKQPATGTPQAQQLATGTQQAQQLATGTQQAQQLATQAQHLTTGTQQTQQPTASKQQVQQPIASKQQVQQPIASKQQVQQPTASKQQVQQPTASKQQAQQPTPSVQDSEIVDLCGLDTTDEDEQQQHHHQARAAHPGRKAQLVSNSNRQPVQTIQPGSRKRKLC